MVLARRRVCAMSVTKLHERRELIERAYLDAIGDFYPENVSWAIKQSAILNAVPDARHEEIVEMLNWRRRKANRSAGPFFGSVDLIKTLIDLGMCEDCAIRVVPLICTRATALEDCICSDKCADALDRWAHPFGSKSNAAPCLYPFQAQLDRALARARSREAARGAGLEPVGR